MRYGLQILASIAVAFFAVDAANAQGFPTRDELAVSCWDSTYTTADGSRVGAYVEFNGRNGTYDTPFGQGRLSNITYRVDPRIPSIQIDGNWSFLGQSGRFLFTSQDGQRFSGSWNSNAGTSGRWWGTLAR